MSKEVQCWDCERGARWISHIAGIPNWVECWYLSSATSLGSGRKSPIETCPHAKPRKEKHDE